MSLKVRIKKMSSNDFRVSTKRTVDDWTRIVGERVKETKKVKKALLKAKQSELEAVQRERDQVIEAVQRERDQVVESLKRERDQILENLKDAQKEKEDIRKELIATRAERESTNALLKKALESITKARPLPNVTSKRPSDYHILKVVKRDFCTDYLIIKRSWN